MFLDENLTPYIYAQQRDIHTKLKKIENFNHRDEYYKIKDYLDDFIENNIENRFLVMPGLRGVGKTTIVLQLYDYLLNQKNINKDNILYLSMDKLTAYFQTDLLKTVDLFLKEVHKTDQVYLNEKIFIFVDEAHFDKKWAIAGKIIYDTTNNIFLVCTGSSAIDLEINADVARRISKEQIFPNNFEDYLLLKKNTSLNYNFSKKLQELIYFGQDYINEAIQCEKKVYDKFNLINNNPKIEFENFLKYGGFPSTINFNEEESYKKILTIVEDIILKDIPSIQSLNSSTIELARQIILYIALQKQEGTSNQKIADYLSISASSVREILGILEKTQLIFNVKPFGGPGKIIRKPWVYYFLSPSIKASMNFEIARYNLNDKKCLGELAENLVASSLYKMSKTTFKFMGLFYLPKKGMADFLIKTKLDDLVPIELGIGNKTKSQLIKTMDKYDSEYGILVSSRYERIKKEDDIIHIPLMSFGFI